MAMNLIPCIDESEDSFTGSLLAKALMQRLVHLKVLHDNDFITLNDYELRKSQIVDELTGVNLQALHVIDHEPIAHINTSKDKVQIRRKKHHKHRTIKVVPHSPPDWCKIPSEKAEKWIYNYTEERWMIEVPFDKGGLRYVFHLYDEANPNKKYVAKLSQDIMDTIHKEIYFNDVRMQAIARYFCNGDKGYNSYSPPKHVDFLEAFVVHLTQREGSPVCHMEKYIEGKYTKYNNNVGWISDDERNTPHAFAHFTYEASKGKLLICDIQGVNDVYTDPQVHSTENKKAFGRGNLGRRGFEMFLRHHRCNPICKYLTLHSINCLPVKTTGTMPLATRISINAISTIHFDFDSTLLEHNISDGFPSISCTNAAEGENTSCWAKLCVVL